MVGTLNYVAPEVLHPGNYKHTSDYWSAGHVGHEIICGSLPFLCHLDDFGKRQETIRAKGKNVINIVPKIDGNGIEYGYKLPLNHCSPMLNERMEIWLSLSLDSNYKTRGRDDYNNLRFYKLLDEILDDKILTVFSLKKYKKCYYNLKSFKNLKEFVDRLCLDNDISLDNIFFITPPSHPKKQLQHPSDYFVAEWCDSSNKENPPVMLYVYEFKKRETAQIEMAEYFAPYKLMKKLMSISPQKAINIPSWLLKQFENEVHFILTKEQNLLTCYMLGLQGFVMELERHVFYYEKHIDVLYDKILKLLGKMELFSVIVAEVIKLLKISINVFIYLFFFVLNPKFFLFEI